MSNKIEEIKRVLHGGAKATKYRIEFAFPNEIQKILNVAEVACLAKSASFPEKTLGTIEVWNQGRKLPIQGDTSYSNTWDVAFYLDREHKIRKQFLIWQKACDNFQANTHSAYPEKLMVSLSACQLDSLEQPLTKYTFQSVFPTVVGDVQVGADSIDTIEEFTVTFSFSDWIIAGDEGDEFDHPEINVEHSKNVIAPDQ